MNFLDSANANQTYGLWVGPSDCSSRVLAYELTLCTTPCVKLQSQEQGGNSVVWIVFYKSGLQILYCLWSPCD